MLTPPCLFTSEEVGGEVEEGGDSLGRVEGGREARKGICKHADAARWRENHVSMKLRLAGLHCWWRGSGRV